MSRLRLGFIGAGGYGRVQIDGFRELQAQGLVQITALADSSPAVLKAMDDLPDLRDAKRFTDHRALFASAGLDAVVLTVPISLHEQITLAALERDLVILLEKPPVPLLSQLERLIEADVHGRVMVGFQHIYSKIIRGLKRELVGGRIGKIQSISAHGLWPRSTAYYQRSVWAGHLAWQGQPVLDGPCTNAFAHFINLLLYLAGAREEAFALPVQAIGEAYRARPEIDTYDTGCMSGVLENDIRLFFGFSHASDTAAPVEIRIEGNEGRLRLFDDCETLQFGDEECIRGDCGRHEMRRAFAAFAAGDAAQNHTSLSSTRAYLLATNLMLASSGRITSIPESHVQVSHPGGPDALYAIENLAAYMSQSARQLSPLADASAPWAQTNAPLSVSHFSEADLVRAFDLLPGRESELSTGSVIR